MQDKSARGLSGSAGFVLPLELPQWGRQDDSDSNSKIVSSPVFDSFFDLLPGQVVLKGLLGEFNHLIIGRKTEAN